MTILLACIFIAAAETPPSFDAFFADFAKKRDGVHVLEARFAQTNVSSEETIESSGTVVYVKPRRIVFRYEKPDAGVTYLIHGRKAYEYEPDIKQLQIYSLEDNPRTEVFFLGFDDNTDSLRAAYDVDVFESSEDKAQGSRGIAIRPKKSEDVIPAKAGIQEVKLFLRDADYLPYHIHIKNDDDSQVDIRITDYAINSKLEPAKTRIALPEGIKVIEDDQVLETVGVGGKSVPTEDVISAQPLPEPVKKDTPAP